MSEWKRRASGFVLAIPAALALLGAALSAGEPGWTQWGGPRRNFTADVKGLATAWPAEGPRRLWSRALGEGYSSMVVDGGTLYTLYRRESQEVVIALDASSGATVWEHAYDAPIVYGFRFGAGPRATPLIVGDLVFAVGASGKLHGLNKRTGQLAWAHDLLKDYNGYAQEHLYASSPIAYKDTVIVPVGAPGAALMAFNQKDGTVAWRALDFKSGYAAPILIDVDGQQQLVAFMEEHIIGVEPGTGALLWSRAHKANTPINSSTPVWGDDNVLFCSSAYDGGSRALKLSRSGTETTVEEIWYQRLMRIHFSTVTRVGDVLYGSSGDFGPTPFTAVDAKTGKVLWRDRSLLKVNVIQADGKFIMLDEDGLLMLATPGVDGIKVLSKVQLLTNNAWTPPALDGTRLYLRDRHTILAVDLK